MIDIILYSSSGPASFLLDLNDDEVASNPSLEIVHGEHNRVRHFMTVENLRTLRDLLNEKLPPPNFEKLLEDYERNEFKRLHSKETP